MTKRGSYAEELLVQHLKAVKESSYVREYRFAAIHVGLGKGIRQRLKDANLKDWRFDFAWIELKLAVEVEGGGWVSGRHTRGAGFLGDLMKYDAAQRMDWTVYRCAPEMVKNGMAISTIQRLLAVKREKKCGC